MIKKAIFLAVILPCSFAYAAHIRQLLNEQNLAIIELEKNESAEVGDNFIVSEKSSQCLLKVLQVTGKNVTVSSSDCKDKTFLVQEKKVEKSLFDPALLAKPSETSSPKLLTENPRPFSPPAPENSTVAEHPISSSLSTGPLDLHYFPTTNEFVGFTTLKTSSSSMSGSLNGTKLSLSSDYTSFSQSIGVGILNNFAISLEVPYIISGSSEFQLGTTKTSEDYDSNVESALMSIAKRIQIGTSSDTKNYVEIRYFYKPEGSDDNYLTDNYMGVSLSSGVALSDLQKLVAALEYINIGESDTLESRTGTGLAIRLQRFLGSQTFVQLAGQLIILSDEVSKTTNITVSYNHSPVAILAIGQTFREGTVDWLLAYSLAQGGADIRIGASKFGTDDTKNTVSLSLGYRYR
jgi:hypothetical protein